jgi:diguanylate cyclase (GGDEF)-like protein
MMARDTFLREWMLEGEQDAARISHYLHEISESYGMVVSFLVSVKTTNYYHADGILKQVSPDEPRDVWFYRSQLMDTPYEINIDVDLSNRDTVTFFVNHKVFDFNSKLIGVAGVGLTLDSFSRLIEEAQQRFNRTIYFVNSDGIVTAADRGEKSGQLSLADMTGGADIQAAIRSRSVVPLRLTYHRGGREVNVSSRYIPELNWYLVVEQDDAQEVLPLQRIFYLNLLISLMIMIAVMSSVFYVINRFRRRLENAAATDPMTGLLNRQAFGLVFRQAVAEQSRQGGDMAVMLLDIDHFKQVNDSFGHASGDQVIDFVVQHLRQTVREMDMIARWGGDEFFILLKQCNVDQAEKLAEKLCRAVERYPLQMEAGTCAVSVSIGVADYVPGEGLSLVFARADKGLYAAKASGRNCVVVGE